MPQIGAAWTFMCWVLLDAIPGASSDDALAGYAEAWNSSTHDKELYLQVDASLNKLWVAYIYDGASKTAAYQDNTIAIGKWYHLVGTHVGAGNLKLYVDGVDRATLATSGNSYTGYATPELLTAPATRITTQTAVALNGRVAEVKLWNAALTLNEILQEMRCGAPVSKLANLQAYWPLWGVASPEPDLSGQGKNGTVTGAISADHAPVGPYVVPFSPRSIG